MPRLAGLPCALPVLAAVLMAGCRYGGISTTQPDRRAEAVRRVEGVRYFFVVPQWLPDGHSSRSERKALEGWLVRRAGGYTRIGPCRGGWHDGKDLIEEDSIAYLVVGPRGLKVEIERRMVDHFKQQQAFVVQW